MNTIEYEQKAALPDSDLIEGLALHEDYLGVIYKKHKQYCVKFMQKQCNGKDYDEVINDIYHDALLVLYEKVSSGNFTLTSSIQTYLNSICRYQLLNKFKDDNRYNQLPEAIEFDNEDVYSKYSPEINDWLPNDGNDINSDRVRAITAALEKMKNAKGNCYELLSMFYYRNKTMRKIAEYFEYANDQIAQNQAYRCREKLRTLSFETMKKIG